MGDTLKERGRKRVLTPESEKENKKPKRCRTNSVDSVGDIVVKKRGPGRPRTANVETLRPFKVTVFVVIPTPPKHVASTGKKAKTIKQDPKLEGPFTLTWLTTWGQFLSKIAVCLDISERDLQEEEMSWNFKAGNSAKAVELPLTNEAGFKVLQNQIQALKDPSATIVLVHHPLPIRPRRRAGGSDIEDGSLGEQTQWGEKVSLDRKLAPIIDELKELHPEGRCQIHPGIRCYTYVPKGWHIDLDNARLQVWALAILRKQTGMMDPPFGSSLFTAKDKLSMPNNNLYASGPHVNPMTPRNLGAFPGSLGSPWNQNPFLYTMPNPSPPPLPQMYPHFSGYPSAPSPANSLWGYPPLPVIPGGSPSVHVQPTSHHEVILFQPSNLKMWCAEQDLGDEEYRGLMKLGFRVGGSLDGITLADWAWAGLGPLHINRIMNAVNGSN